ncbi:MAG: MupG family TIM beta-alpha barrel fold protein [Liquorilactobacillus ghanensis]|uniref:DUF871 domain-containing protein n=2 Tax=Liquorilactobacillus ghanensis TaxID=399370 RepID=UPI0039EA8328
MKNLGISIYPENSTLEEDINYLKLAHENGFSRVFTSLLQVNNNDKEIINRYRSVINYANKLDFKVVIDINPTLFKKLGISYDDLKFFKDLGVWGLRLDEGFSGIEEAKMTRNPYHLKIEINMSTGSHYLDNIMTYDPDTNNLLGCHNFYPQRYTGLSDENFIKYSKIFYNYNIHSAAFVSSNNATFGPWPINEGLPTLEEDRFKRIEVQVQHLKFVNAVDDIIIGNAYASEEELITASKAFYSNYPVLEIEFLKDITDFEKKIIEDNVHLYRGDASEYLLRDTLMRVKYHEKSIPPKKYAGRFFSEGDVLIANDDYSRYKGEVQIVKKKIENDGRRNLIGSLTNESKKLLKYVHPWSSFIISQVSGEK